MQYRFAVSKRDYSHLSPGYALTTRPGSPAFPVRLAEEMFLRCREVLLREGREGPYTIYDPCCGSGYLLAVVAFLFSGDVSRVVASDADPEAVEFAARNLGLLSHAGLATRSQQLRAEEERYGRSSAVAGIESCLALEAALSRDIPGTVFQANALEDDLAVDGDPVDMVLTDVPHGDRSRWMSASAPMLRPGEPEGLLVANLHRSLGRSRPVVAVASQKRLAVEAPGVTRLARFAVGKRQVLFFRGDDDGHHRRV